MRRPLCLSAFLTVVVPTLGVLSCPGASRAEVTPIEVEAARMEFDRKAGVARFEGEVRVRQADLELRCARLTATYSKAGEVLAQFDDVVLIENGGHRRVPTSRVRLTR